MVPAPEVVEAPMKPPPLVPASVPAPAPNAAPVVTPPVVTEPVGIAPALTRAPTATTGPAPAQATPVTRAPAVTPAPAVTSAPAVTPTAAASSAPSVTPVVTSSPTPQAQQSATPAPEPEPDFPLWQVSALGTATLPTALDGSAFLVGARAELDLWRIGLFVTVDQSGTTPFSLSSGQQWTALGGYAVLVNKWARLRLLGGVSGTSTTTLAPTVGANVRVGWSFLGAEAAAVLTPFGAFQQLDVRAEGILRGGIFELHAGYRARFLDATGAGTLFTSAPLAGPHVAVGLAF